MTLNYETHAKLCGTAPLPAANGTVMRGGEIAKGGLAKMVKRAVECLDQGYAGVMVLYGGGALNPQQIREVFGRKDFPSD